MAEDFLNDIDKMYDFLDDNISMNDFLISYPYITKEDYLLTLDKFNNNIAEELANLLRDAENMLLEENTCMEGENPYAGFLVKGNDLKWRVADYVREHLTEEEQEEFYEIAESMAC